MNATEISEASDPLSLEFVEVVKSLEEECPFTILIESKGHSQHAITVSLDNKLVCKKYISQDALNGMLPPYSPVPDGSEYNVNKKRMQILLEVVVLHVLNYANSCIVNRAMSKIGN